jgi:hypothetical protein
MTLTRKLASALCLAFLSITLSSNAQVDSTTGNLINYGTSATDTTSTWNNGVYVNQLCFGAGQPGNCGPNPSVRPGGYINFSYGTADLNQIVNINRALAAGGTGVQLSGFNFGFTAKNGNHWDDARQDYLSAYVRLRDSAGNQIANYDYTDQTNRKYNWTNFNFSETFASPYVASTLSTAQVGFIGRDNNFWAGNYGPEIFDVSFSLKYRVNPCATNPAYSSTCTGFNSIVTSNNILPNPDAWGTSINQMVAINTALKNGGAGAMVHGFNYGFDYNVGQSWSGCTATNQDGSCSWYMNIPASVSATALLTNSSNQTIVSKNHSLTGDGTSGSVSGQYLLSSSLNQTALGNLRLYGSASGTGSSLGNFSASLIYTVDPCNANPLYNTSCSGYGAAMAKSLAPPTSSPAMPAMPLSPSGTSPMDNNGPGQGPADGSFNPSGPGPASQQATVTASSEPPGSPPTAGPASQQVAQSNGPSSTSSNTSGPAQRQESGGKSGGGGNLSLAMSVVSRVQAADRATQASAVANAQQVVATSSAAAQEQANQVVEQANALSAESSQASQAVTASSTSSSSQQTSSSSTGGLQGPVVMSIQSLTTNAIQSSSTGTTQSVASTTSQSVETTNAQSQNSQGLALQLPQPTQVTTSSVQQSSSIYTPPTASMTSELPVVQSSSSQGLPLQAPQVSETVQSATQAQLTYQPPVVATNESNSIYSLTAGIAIRPSQGINLNSQANTTTVAIVTPQMMQQRQEFKFETRTEQEQPQVFQQPQTATTRGSILNDIIEQRVNVASFQMEQQMDTVKKNVLPNELAGGVDIAAMAMVPKGYETYSIVTLRDVPFYKPEAIYKDNKTVDNARVLRGLTSGSDAKHQEMVNQQYK